MSDKDDKEAYIGIATEVGAAAGGTTGAAVAAASQAAMVVEFSKVAGILSSVTSMAATGTAGSASATVTVPILAGIALSPAAPIVAAVGTGMGACMFYHLGKKIFKYV